MPRFSDKDVNEILEALEEGLDFLPQLPIVKKMQFRSKIRQQEHWLRTWSNPPVDGLLDKFEHALPEVFRLYPADFSVNFTQLLRIKTARLR